MKTEYGIKHSDGSVTVDITGMAFQSLPRAIEESFLKCDEDCDNFPHKIVYRNIPNWRELKEADSAFQWCLECGHRYATKKDLRRTYIKSFWETVNANPSSGIYGWVEDRVYKFLKLFTRTKKIHFCPFCLHDF